MIKRTFILEKKQYEKLKKKTRNISRFLREKVVEIEKKNERVIKIPLQSTDTVTVSIYLPKELDLRLYEILAKNQVSFSDLMRYIIAKEVK